MLASANIELIDAMYLLSRMQGKRGEAFEDESLKHDGCVNTVAWNSSGSILASGSDDRTVKLWSLNPHDSYCQVTGQTRAIYSERACISTGHEHNIFSVAWVPGSDSSELVTCAGDGDVMHHRLHPGGGDGMGEIIHTCGDLQLIHQVIFAPDSSSSLFIAEGSGAVRCLDLRAPHREEPSLFCTSGGKEYSCKCIAFAPHNVPEVAVGGGGAVVRVYDYRMPPKVSLFLISLFSPFSLRHFSNHSLITTSFCSKGGGPFSPRLRANVHVSSQRVKGSQPKELAHIRQ